MEDTTLATPINGMTNDELRKELADNGVTLHHKTGAKKLAATLAKVRTDEYKEEPSSAIPPKKDPLSESTEASRAAKAKHLAAMQTPEKLAMKLTRVVVTPNDPTMVNYPGLIFTVGASGLNNGRMVKKFVPFSNEEGWHVPTIILNQIINSEMQKFKTVARANGEKVLEPYLTKKFNVRILDPLTREELEQVAAANKVAGFSVGATN